MELLTFIIFSSIFKVLSIYIIFLKIDILKVVGYELWVDIVFTVGLGWLMINTFNGIMTATVAGLMLACMLRVTRYLFGYKKWTPKGWIYYCREGVLGEPT